MGKSRALATSRSERFLGNHQYGDRYVDGGTTVELELSEEDVWSVDEPTEESACTSRSREASGGERRSNVRRHVGTSAPVKVPEWSKILKVESIESMRIHDADVAAADWESEMVPPHEYVARSRNGDGVSSVFLGVGRTLKGRDMRRVRDTVWSQTGFYG